MTCVIGIDEAGYGPNLGPLCIGLSLWQVPDNTNATNGARSTASPEEIDLFELLTPMVCGKPDGRRVAIADSKLLYKPKGGLRDLERGVLAMLAASGADSIDQWKKLVDHLHADRTQQQAELPWMDPVYHPAVPAAVAASDLQAAADSIAECSAATLCEMRAVMVHAREFNAACEEYASKGLALSRWSLGLLRDAIDTLPTSESTPTVIQVTCDKHGGRNNYAGLLTEFFPEYALRVIVESRPRSAYLLTSSAAELRIEFRTKGEARLETALASMVAKYLRELSMEAFNQYWQSHLPTLKPTAGYPLDAKRFKADIAKKQQELGIDDAILWRNR
ncbi:hypothetical protein [Aeoliella mucimassa]|uniref:Uncharacterized protein n=1 Tax=Aeoliella mucimassa TaxID=2527972 RepID=A0A518AH93_9BACT|nr:hypothetical protein [Aeoliella mucimassa]QDU54086.1 Hypothetical protein Pan181_02660 [Aeoliella mucimassa]